jgi:hypothetical protein
VRVTPQGDTINSLTIHSDLSIQSDPAVVFCGENFVAVWSDSRFSSNSYWITAAAVDTAGVVADTSICVGAQTMASEQYPDIAFDGNKCFVVWYNSDEPFGVYGRFLDELGWPEDSVKTVATTSAGYNVNPSIAFAADKYLVVWADRRPGYSDLDICGQFLSASVGAIGEQFTIASGEANQMYPQVCSNGMRFLVVWREATTNVCGQWYDTLGSPLGNTFQISDSTSFYRFRAGVDASPTEFLAAWSEVHNDETDIFGSTGIETACEERTRFGREVSFVPTVVTDFSKLSQGRQYKTYDVCGRDVTNVMVSCGIYYIQVGNDVIKKIVLVK